MPSIEHIAKYASSQMNEALIQLGKYISFPAISCEQEHASDVHALALEIRKDLEEIGLENCRLLELDDALPIVAADWLHAGDDKPVVLIYGHLDLQPVKGEPWTTPPHEATIIGDRLYGRGAADDMGGWLSHIVSLNAWFTQNGAPPCNIKIIIEGEEEIGSPNLERFMDTYPDSFGADIMVLTDCENPSPEIPGLTISLRGLLEMTITCSAIRNDIHSGLWGGMVPDVSIALIQLIHRLIDDDGRMKVGRVEVPDDWQEAAWNIPLDSTTIRKDAGIIPDASPLPTNQRPPAEWLWRQPSVTIIATTLPTHEFKKNALRRSASATLSIRLPPQMPPNEMKQLIKKVLLESPPSGVKTELEFSNVGGEGWLYEPKGPAFDAADRAYTKVWGRPLLHIGVGGSIPFVAIFGKRYGNLPLILNGVMDPKTSAHGPNESMHLGIFQKTLETNVHLLAQLAELSPEELQVQEDC
jgi:cysteinylglycine-S-conjugate dipeptidase